MILESIALIALLSTTEDRAVDFVSAISRARAEMTDAVFLEAKVDDDQGDIEFEIEFVRGSERIEIEIEADDGASKRSTQQLDEPALAALRPLVERLRAAKITPERALEIAQAKVEGAKVREIESKVDSKARLVFEVELRTTKSQFEVDVDAATGEVVDVDEAPLADRKATVLSFDDAAIGTLPTGFTIAGTAQDGPLATWNVAGKASADDKDHVLRLERPNHTSGPTFNLCWNPELTFLDGVLAVKLRADAGEEDQGGGLLWRALDPDNYYITRFNPLESNLRIYTVKGGKRAQLGSAQVEGKLGAWYELRVEHTGKRMRVALDGKLLLEIEDDSFPEAGGIGLWTKADAATSFDDLRIEPRQP